MVTKRKGSAPDSSSSPPVRKSRRLAESAEKKAAAEEAISAASAPKVEALVQEEEEEQHLSRRRWEHGSKKAVQQSEDNSAAPVMELQTAAEQEEDMVKEEDGGRAAPGSSSTARSRKARRQVKKEEEEDDDARFIGEPSPGDEARRQWPHRYFEKGSAPDSSSSPPVRKSRRLVESAEKKAAAEEAISAASAPKVEALVQEEEEEQRLSRRKREHRSKKAVQSEDSAAAPVMEAQTAAEQEEEEEEDMVKEEDGGGEEGAPGSSSTPHSRRARRQVKKDEDDDARFIGEPLPEDEARRQWPHRYLEKKYKEKQRKAEEVSNAAKDDESEEKIEAKKHFSKAEVDGHIYELGDYAHVKAEDGQPNYICKIVEMFEAADGLQYFTAQWFYRGKDTVIKTSYDLDDKRVFLSEVKDDNALGCLVEKINVALLPLDVDMASKEAALSGCDYYCDTMYLNPYTSFVKLPLGNCSIVDNMMDGSESESTVSGLADAAGDQEVVSKRPEKSLLDLYSGCGAMSTGLCLGANIADMKLVTKWAVDLNQYACDSLKLNHPETQVRNESAENFLSLLKEWEKLCISFKLIGSGDLENADSSTTAEEAELDDDDESDDNDADNHEVFEVEKVLDICYGDPKENGKLGLYYKIRWKGYGADDDTWEPEEGLSDCQDRIKEFVKDGFNSMILPLPGTVDVICGGPPCQGVSGFNRFRDRDNPLADEKNKQLMVFMEIVEYLKPSFVLMENVVDLVKFCSGFLGRYALGRLVAMNYQARMGLMVAGAYGLAQFRMRVFMWGAHPREKLPQYPLPTHDVVQRGNIPTEFESNVVAYDQGSMAELEKKLLLCDAISDLPPVKNDEPRDEMHYMGDPLTDFQKHIRLRKHEMPGCLIFGSERSEHVLYDHRPLKLNEDDYLRVCKIPKRKGANFRDLKGVRVREDNKVEWDPDVERELLPSGKPLVPDYAMTFVRGTSTKPFGRLWWDETVPTVVTRAEPHNQIVLHPLQDRVLTIRENARLQGFPDYYKLVGPIKERYIQVGNAVAVPVARALGWALAQAFRGSGGGEPVFTLPKKFPRIANRKSTDLNEDQN